MFSSKMDQLEIREFHPPQREPTSFTGFVALYETLWDSIFLIPVFSIPATLKENATIFSLFIH